MITKRDAQMIAWLHDVKCAHTATIQAFWYPSYSVATTRLKTLTRMHEIRRERSYWGDEYIYYPIKQKPKQMKHAVLLTDFYRELHKLTDVKKFIIEPTFNSVRPDAVCGFVHNGVNRLALIEVAISNNKDLIKYSTFDWRKHFPIQPEIFCISDKQHEINGYKATVIKTNMMEVLL